MKTFYKKNPDRPLTFQTLEDAELLNLTAHAAAKEKEATMLLIDYLVEVDSRKLYATKAYSSLFDYLVRELKFSEPAAADRVNTVRLIRAVPKVKTHLERGDLTLTSASQIQRFIKTEEKVNFRNKSVSLDKKIEVVNLCLGQSKREVEKTLFGQYSEAARIVAKESVRLINHERIEIKFTVDEAFMKKLAHLKDMIGAKALECIFEGALDALISKEEKKRGQVKTERANHLETMTTDIPPRFEPKAMARSIAAIGSLSIVKSPQIEDVSTLTESPVEPKPPRITKVISRAKRATRPAELNLFNYSQNG